MSPLNDQRAGLGASQNFKITKKTNTMFSHLQRARVVRYFPIFAWW